MEMTIRYTSSRKEVWEWYWYSWRKKMWKFHLFFLIVFIVMAISVSGGWPPNWNAELGVLGYAVFLFGIFIAGPQILFKPQERTITITDDNLYTKIGKREAHIKWKQFGNIDDHGDFIILSRRNLNSFIIPNRAFSNTAERDKFLTAVKHLLSGAKGFPNLISEARDTLDLE